jgi:hypothetical protein
MAFKPSKGWLPIEIGMDHQPALVREGLVRWMEFGAEPLAEPFITHTVDRLREKTPPAREIDTDLETVVRAASRIPWTRPAGFIFHISHCGSTLVANALKMSDQSVVVSESRAASQLLRDRSESLVPALRAEWEGTRGNLLSSIFCLFASYRTDQPQPLILKFPSADTLRIRWVRSRWPDVPCLILIRDPAEVMVQSLEGGGWLTLKDRPGIAADVLGWQGLASQVEAMTKEEFCARVLGEFFASALDALTTPGACLVLDYVDLDPERMREIAAFFGIELRNGGKDVEQVFRSYAKDPRQEMPFYDDREFKQHLATVLIRSAASRWAMEGYNALSQRRPARKASKG